MFTFHICEATFVLLIHCPRSKVLSGQLSNTDRYGPQWRAEVNYAKRQLLRHSLVMSHQLAIQAKRVVA